MLLRTKASMSLRTLNINLTGCKTIPGKDFVHHVQTLKDGEMCSQLEFISCLSRCSPYTPVLDKNGCLNRAHPQWGNGTVHWRVTVTGVCGAPALCRALCWSGAPRSETQPHSFQITEDLKVPSRLCALDLAFLSDELIDVDGKEKQPDVFQEVRPQWPVRRTLRSRPLAFWKGSQTSDRGRKGTSLDRGSPNYDPWAKSSPPSVFVQPWS